MTDVGFFLILQKAGFVISFRLFHKMKNCMKCRTLHSKKMFINVLRRIFLPNMLIINYPQKTIPDKMFFVVVFFSDRKY